MSRRAKAARREGLKGLSRRARLRRRLRRVERRAVNGPRGCLACLLTAELCQQALEAPLGRAFELGREAAGYAARGGVYGCLTCAESCDALGDAGVHGTQLGRLSRAG